MSFCVTANQRPLRESERLADHILDKMEEKGLRFITIYGSASFITWQELARWIEEFNNK